MQFGRRVLATACAGVMCAMCVPLGGISAALPNVSWTVCADEELNDSGTYGDLAYSVENETVTITGCDTSATVVEIPSEMDGYAVTSIASDAFSGCTNLTSIKIPDSVTSIGTYTFYNCESLVSVSLSNNVTEIPYAMFRGCTSLTSVTIPGGVTSIGGYAFYGCASLESVVIPSSVTSVGKYAFYNCTSLAEVYYTGTESKWNGISIESNNSYLTAANITYSYVVTTAVEETTETTEAMTTETTTTTVSTITETTNTTAGPTTTTTEETTEGTEEDPYAYLAYSVENETVTITGCDTSATVIEIPSEIDGYVVTSIASDAFSGCTNLTSIKIPDSVTSIGTYTFYNCESLVSVSLSNNVTEIPYAMFRGCTSLTSVTIPGGVTSIGGYAFYGCASLESVVIPSSVTSVGKYAFYNCTSLAEVYYTGTESKWNGMSIESNNSYLTAANITYSYVVTTAVEETTETTEAMTTATTTTTTTTSADTENSTTATEDTSLQAYADQVVALVNLEREAEGLNALYAVPILNTAATVRAEECVELFSHTRPDGTSCFTVLSDYSIFYLNAGENIAMGQMTPESVVNAWMNSEGHRANIMGEDYAYIGVGVYYEDGVYYWVQEFLGTYLTFDDAYLPEYVQETTTTTEETTTTTTTTTATEETTTMTTTTEEITTTTTTTTTTETTTTTITTTMEDATTTTTTTSVGTSEGANLIIETPYVGNLYVGNTFQLVYTVDADYTGELTWFSSDAAIATVSQEGEVTVNGEGTVTVLVMDDSGTIQSISFTTFELVVTTTEITATTETETMTTTTTTTKIESCAVSVETPYLGNLYVGSTFQLEYTTEDNYTGGITWFSSDATVATITQDGAVTVNGEGTVTILAMDDNGNSSSITFTTFALSTTVTDAEGSTETTTTESTDDTGTTTTESGNMGDLDDDGSISLNDAYLALLAYANAQVGLSSGLTDAQEIAADIDGDNSITINDAYLILLYYAQSQVGLHPTWEELLNA